MPPSLSTPPPLPPEVLPFDAHAVSVDGGLGDRAVVEDAAAVVGGGVVRHGAVRDGQGAAVVDATAAAEAGSRCCPTGAVRDGQGGCCSQMPPP